MWRLCSSLVQIINLGTPLCESSVVANMICRRACCLTVHARLFGEALGQYLSLPKWRHSAGYLPTNRLLGIMREVHMETPIDFVSIWVHQCESQTMRG